MKRKKMDAKTEARIEAEIIRQTKLGEDVHCKVFKAIQLITYYVLYYDQDFSKQQLKNFNKFLKKHNEEMKMHDIKALVELDETLKRNVNIDCRKMAVEFPHRPKMKLYGKKTKDSIVVLNNATDCIEDFLLICIHTLRTNYKFSAKRINEWWEQVIEFSRLYTEGLTDEHVIKYFMQECELEITEQTRTK